MKQPISILVLLLCCGCFAVPAFADDEPEASIDKISWASAPSYIQLQAKNVVLHCSAGEYTPNQVQIYQYSNSTTGQDNYILDFSAMKALTQQIPGCNYNSPVCGPQGCFVIAYTQISNKTWDQSWFGAALKIKMIGIEQNGKSFPAVEVLQGAESCTIVNGGKGPCPMHFTWRNKKFKYYGYAKIDAIEAGSDGSQAPGFIMPLIPATPDEPEPPPQPAPVAEPPPPTAVPEAAPTPVPEAAPVPPTAPPAEPKPADDL